MVDICDKLTHILDFQRVSHFSFAFDEFCKQIKR